MKDKPISGSKKDIEDEELQVLLEEEYTQFTSDLAKRWSIDSSKKMDKILKMPRWVPRELFQRRKVERVKTSLVLLARQRKISGTYTSTYAQIKICRLTLLRRR